MLDAQDLRVDEADVPSQGAQQNFETYAAEVDANPG